MDEKATPDEAKKRLLDFAKEHGGIKEILSQSFDWGTEFGIGIEAKDGARTAFRGKNQEVARVIFRFL